LVTLTLLPSLSQSIVRGKKWDFLIAFTPSPNALGEGAGVESNKLV